MGHNIILAKPTKRKHREYRSRYITQLPNGCQHYTDCFTCPFSDCILSDKEAAIVKRVLIIKEK